MLNLPIALPGSFSIRAHIAALISIGVLLIMSSSPVLASNTQSAYPTDAESFAFLNGEWRVFNKRLKEPFTGRNEWTEFEVRAKFFTLLDGLVSVEELRDASGAPFGGAMRTFDRERRTWSDAWVSARDGVLQLPSHGRFEGNAGNWDAPDTHNGKPIIARGTWKRITKDEVHWEQQFSPDNGKTWELNWKMRFERLVAKDKAGK